MAGRRAKRIRAVRQIMVGFTGASTRFAGTLVDISRTGLLMRCPHDLALETGGRIAIELGVDVLRCTVKVRRRVPDVGLAVEFIQMRPRDRELLHRLLVHLESVLTEA